MIFASSLLSHCWQFATRHPGIVLVLLGVVGEVVFDWKEMKGKMAWAKRLSAIVLIAGLMLEFSEAAKSDKEVSAAMKSAGLAEQKAGEANERAANTESNNLALRATVAKLEAKNRWRTITPEQKRAFIESTKGVLKLPIRVRMGANANAEIQSFGKKIRELLDEAGFVETNKDLAIAEWPPEMNMLWDGTGPEMPPILFLNNISPTRKPADLQNAQEKLKTYASYSTNSFVKTEFMLVYDDADPEAYVTDDNGSPILHIKFPDRAPFQPERCSCKRATDWGLIGG